nr:uncharacterized protein LOC112281708 isoform X1 [Physcomitrium patens]|eukprot:XP_024374297.1 uncharacterized protein LOC112281708 isoform X1 [Physcomitrella patens]
MWRKDLGLTGAFLEAAQWDEAEFAVTGGERAIAIGVFLAILSAVANGSFAVLSKTRSIRRARVSPLIFNFWACLGVLLSSLLLLFKYKFVFALEGLLSGVFFVLSFINIFRAVRLLGVSVAYGIWAGTAAIVSFMARELFEGTTKNLSLAGLAILVIIIGVLGVAWSGQMSWEPQDFYEDDDHTQTLIQSQSPVVLQPSFAGWVQHRKLWDVAGQSKSGERPKNVLTGEPASRSFPAGVFSAVLAGILGGLVMIPANQAPDMAQGNAFLPSFGIAVAIFTPIVTSLPYLSGCELPDLSAREAAGPGILSGFIYNIGNMLNIVAIFYVGSSVAYPLFQCGIIVAGIWGMLYFEESHGNALITLWAADVVLLVGIILLSLTH